MDLDRLHFILGFLLETDDGRLVRDDDPDRVETFFGDEQGAAPIFERHLEALARERRIATGIRETAEEGRIVFRSRELAALINGCYDLVSPSGYVSVETGAPIAKELRMSPSLLNGKEPAQRFSFLAGAYVRYGHENAFHILMGDRKADQIGRLLLSAGCKEVVVSYRPGYVPRTYAVSYQPTPEVAAWLARAEEL